MSQISFDEFGLLMQTSAFFQAAQKSTGDLRLCQTRQKGPLGDSKENPLRPFLNNSAFQSPVALCQQKRFHRPAEPLRIGPGDKVVAGEDLKLRVGQAPRDQAGVLLSNHVMGSGDHQRGRSDAAKR